MSISVDRSLATPIADQLLDQLRYEIAEGRFRTGDVLPSTRALAKELGLSFHTVRKAYQSLESEGYVTSEAGVGYRVVENAPVGKAERNERGAAIARDALVRMKSIGLNDEEIDYLIDEQRTLLEEAAIQTKVVVAMPYREMAEECAIQLSSALKIDVTGVARDGLPAHADADYVLVPYEDVRRTLSLMTGADVIGVTCFFDAELLDEIARLGAEEQVVVVVRDVDAVASLMEALRRETGFAGQILAMSIEEDPRHLATRLEQADLVLATASCRRRLQQWVKDHRQILIARRLIASESIERIRELLPR